MFALQPPGSHGFEPSKKEWFYIFLVTVIVTVFVYGLVTL